LDTVRFAVLGFGNIGQRHAFHISQQAGAALVAICDVDDAKQTLARDRFPDVPVYGSLDALLIESVPGTVLCICTPNGLHAAHAVTAIQNGLEVVVEKPMALSVVECDQMIAASEQTGRRIFAVKQNRYNPPVQAVKQALDAGRLGSVFLIQVNGFWNRNDAYYSQSGWRGTQALDGGCLFTQFSHFVDILYYLNGSVLAAQGRVKNALHQHNTEFEDSGVFSLQAANGALISFCFTTGAFRKNMEGSITVFGERGTVKIGGQYLNTIEYQQLDGDPLIVSDSGKLPNQYGAYEGSMSNHDRVIENVVSVLSGNDPMMTTAAEGREVVRMIEQMYAGAQQN
jgi:predicted dehydrogenase